MELYKGTRSDVLVNGRPTLSQYRKVLINSAHYPRIRWSCLVWADSPKSENEAHEKMMAFINGLGEPVELLDEYDWGC